MKEKKFFPAAIGYRIDRCWVDRQWSAGVCRITSAATAAHAESNCSGGRRLTRCSRPTVLFVQWQQHTSTRLRRTVFGRRAGLGHTCVCAHACVVKSVGVGRAYMTKKPDRMCRHDETAAMRCRLSRTTPQYAVDSRFPT